MCSWVSQVGKNKSVISNMSWSLAPPPFQIPFQLRFWMRALLLLHRQLSSHCYPIWWKEKALVPSLTYKGTNAILGSLCLWNYLNLMTSTVAQLVKNPPAMWETWVRSLGWEDPHGEGKGYPLQYFGLENFTDCIVPGVAESQKLLSNLHFHYSVTSQRPHLQITSPWGLRL